ncbi:MAG: hypothetical protein KKD44_29240 [Proteobacteria bacterium]|nr:hypothetical protein [Pseudomonadota bacterium]
MKLKKVVEQLDRDSTEVEFPTDPWKLHGFDAYMSGLRKVLSENLPIGYKTLRYYEGKVWVKFNCNVRVVAIPGKFSFTLPIDPHKPLKAQIDSISAEIRRLTEYIRAEEQERNFAAIRAALTD